MLESRIQKQISERLRSRGWFVTKLLQSSTNGIPDLLALRNSVTVFIEVKQPGKKPTPLQLFRHKQLRNQGFEVIVAYWVDDVDHLN